MLDLNHQRGCICKSPLCPSSSNNNSRSKTKVVDVGEEEEEEVVEREEEGVDVVVDVVEDAN